MVLLQLRLQHIFTNSFQIIIIIIIIIIIFKELEV